MIGARLVPQNQLSIQLSALLHEVWKTVGLLKTIGISTIDKNNIVTLHVTFMLYRCNETCLLGVYYDRRRRHKLLWRDYLNFFYSYFYSWFHLYGYCLFTYPSPRFPLPSPSSRQSPPPPLRMWPQSFSPMMYRICTRAQENCQKPVPIQSAISPSLSPVYSLWKKWPNAQRFDSRPRTGGHSSKYWPSAKLLDLCDRLLPDTYHTPNAVGNRIINNLC